jgi:hypothetical protein
VSAKPPIDWERIEVDFRAGVKSVREIAAEHGISHTAIVKRSKSADWTRDLSAKIKAKAAALVSKAQVSREVTAETKITEALTVEVEANVRARIELGHRSDIGRGRALTMKLFAELEGISEDPDVLARLGEMMINPEDDKSGRLRAVFDKACSLPGRADTLKKLADSLRILIDKEREAYSIDGLGQGASDYESVLEKVLAAHGS